MEKINLISILGTDRSGSTLLDKIISSNPQCVSLGEAHWLHLYLTHNHLCTCGLPMDKCGFWLDILKRLKGTLFQPEQVFILGWRRRVRIIFNKALVRNRSIEVFYRDYARSYALLCQAVVEHSGKKYIVDSCKDATRLYLLHLSGMFNIMPVYICRPIEDFVVSERTHPLKYYPNRKMGFKKTILRWVFRNAEIRYLLPSLDPDYMQISYMKLVSDPAGTIAAISRKLDVELKYDPQMVQKTDYHFLGGNHMKFRKFSGVIPDQKDVSEVFSSPPLKALLTLLDQLFVRDRLCID